MNPVAMPLDPSKFVIVPETAIVDEFRMTNGDGAFVANIDEAFLAKLVAHMNDRERSTGDLCPVIIGHTPDEPFNEEDGPAVIGYLRNWRVADLFDTGRKAAFADCWIFKEDVERARRFPRRSAEIYTGRYEVDPCSFLGPTTPARDLGLLKLSRDGQSITYTSPYPNPEMSDMPADNKPKADEKNTGESKGLEGKLDQLLSMFQTLMEKLAPQTPAEAPQTPPPAGGEGEGEPTDYDEELEKLLSGLDGEEGAAGAPPVDDKASRKGEEKEKESAGLPGYPGGNDTHVRLSRAEAENENLKVRLSRMEVEATLAKISPKLTEDAALVEDLIVMPPDVRARQLDRLKLARRTPTHDSFHLEHALTDAETGDVKRVRTVAERDQVIKLSRDEKLSYEAAAKRLGYTL
jgi:hypothetical protein